MSSLLGYTHDGATLAAGLGFINTRATIDRGVETSMNGETSNTFAICGGGGVAAGYPLCDPFNSPQSGNGWSVITSGTTKWPKAYGQSTGFFVEISGGGVEIIRLKHAANAALTHASDFVLDVKGREQAVVTNHQFVIAFTNSANNLTTNVCGLLIQNRKLYSMSYNSVSTLALSAGSAVFSVINTDYYYRISYVGATQVLTVTVYSDTWGGTAVATQNHTVVGSLSLNEIHVGSWGPQPGNTCHFQVFEVVTTKCNFQKYLSTSPVENLVSIAVSGSLNPATAEFPVEMNFAAAADTDTYCKYRYGLNGGAKSAWYTATEWKALGTITIGTSIEVDIQYNSSGIQHIQNWNGFLGTITEGLTPTFTAGITALSDNGDGTLVAQWTQATNAVKYEVHVHTAAMNNADLNARTYVVGCVDDDGAGPYSYKVSVTAQGAAKLTAGTTYYVAVRAIGSTGNADTNVVNRNTAVTNPLYMASPAFVIRHIVGVQLGLTATVIYTVPAGKRAICHLKICNTDGTARTMTLYSVPTGDSPADDLALVKDYSLGIKGTVGHTYEEKSLTLEAGSTLQGLASAAAVVTASAQVLEETLG